MRLFVGVLTLATFFAATNAFQAKAQSTGPQGTNQGTPMQQMPAGAPGVGAVKTDAEFVQRAAAANRFEIAESELALSMAQDAKLKEFAQAMVRDHTAALKELKSAAEAAKIAWPAGDSLDPPHQAKVDALKPRKADFDKAYLTDQAQAHRDALAMLETYATSGGNEQLRAWATKTAATVRHHQQMLQALGAR